MAYLRPGEGAPKKGKTPKLSGKMTLFIDHYTNPESPGFKNGSESVRQAGYACKPGNENRIANELLRHPLVAAELASRLQKRAERHELTADYVLNKLVSLVEETGRDSDRIRALELLGKSLSLFKDRQEISGPDGEAIQMEQKINERAEDFTRKLSSLSASRGAGDVVKLVKPAREG